MDYLAQNYFMDMAPLASMSLLEVFRFLADIPFHYDPIEDFKDPKTGKIESLRVEFLKRPYFTIYEIGHGGDCDDKAICMASYCILLGYPYRFAATGTKKPGLSFIPLTHVYTECKINSRWIPCDCTYGFNLLGFEKQYDLKVIL